MSTKLDALTPTLNFDKEFRFEVFIEGMEAAQFPVIFNGFYRKDLSDSSENWHYYQGSDGKIYEFPKKRIVMVTAVSLETIPPQGD